MQKQKLSLLVGSILISSNLYAGGGKMVAPVEAPVIPIPVVKDISGFYLGGGATAARFDACTDGCDYQDVTYGGLLRAGYDFNQYLGLEVRGLMTEFEEGPFGGVPLEHVGIFAKPQYPISEDFNIYTLLGYGYTKNRGSGARLNYFDEDHGFTAGAGLEYDLSDKKSDFELDTRYDRVFDGQADQENGWGLFVDYQRLLIKSDIPNMDVISVGITYDF